MAIVLALLAGLSYAGASVLQQRVASEQRPELSLRPALLLALACRPLWLLGIALDIGVYALEAGALADRDMFGEHLEASGPVAVTVTAVAVVAMVVGTIALARSPLVTHEERNAREPGIPARS